MPIDSQNWLMTRLRLFYYYMQTLKEFTCLRGVKKTSASVASIGESSANLFLCLIVILNILFIFHKEWHIKQLGYLEAEGNALCNI